MYNEEAQLAIEVRVLDGLPHLTLHHLDLLLVFQSYMFVYLLLVDTDLELNELTHVNLRRSLQLVEIGVIVTLLF